VAQRGKALAAPLVGGDQQDVQGFGHRVRMFPGVNPKDLEPDSWAFGKRERAPVS
jgi:hypothetical protein